jgi:hypothetical protein
MRRKTIGKDLHYRKALVEQEKNYGTYRVVQDLVRYSNGFISAKIVVCGVDLHTALRIGRRINKQNALHA